jgi:hypothetical protein
MKPTTTPGNAKGKVSTAINTPRPKKRLRSRKRPAVVETVSAAKVTASDTNTVSTQRPHVAGVGQDVGIDGPATISGARRHDQPHQRAMQECQREDGKRHKTPECKVAGRLHGMVQGAPGLGPGAGRPGRGPGAGMGESLVDFSQVALAENPFWTCSILA